MPLLKAEPPRSVRTVEELFAIARNLEHEAAQNYTALAARARSEGLAELAPLFEQLARDEREHEREIEAWAEQETSTKGPAPVGVSWQSPATFDMEIAGDLASSRLASAYKILSMAVQNEERAFEFWTYVAAQAPSEAIRNIAERMAKGELGHVALMRRARRQAYHAQRIVAGSASSDVGKTVGMPELENLLAERLDRLAEHLNEHEAIRARELAAQSRAMREEAPVAPSPARDRPRADADEVTIAERLVEDYLELGENAHDEAVVAKAQELAARAVSRLAWLRTVVGQSERS